MIKQSIVAYAQQRKLNVKQWLTRKLLTTMYGEGMHISAYPSMTIAGCAVFWYLDNGVRRFVLVRETGDGKKARFVSVMDKGEGIAMNESLLHAIRRTFGQVFFRSLDTKLFEVDRIAAAPAFQLADERMDGQKTTIQSLVWVVQLTKEQAQLMSCAAKDLELITVPEYGLLGNDVAPAHKGVYQTVLRHIHGKRPSSESMVMETLEDLLGKTTQTQRVIH